MPSLRSLPLAQASTPSDDAAVQEGLAADDVAVSAGELSGAGESGADGAGASSAVPLEAWGFADLPQLLPPASEASSSNWHLFALCLAMLVFMSVAWAAWQLRKKRPQELHPLDLALQQLSTLKKSQPRTQEAASRCSQVLCQAWASYYREHLLTQAPLLILQKYAFLRTVPQPLQEPLLLFLAQCVDLAYRPEGDSPSTDKLVSQAEQLLQASKDYPPQR